VHEHGGEQLRVVQAIGHDAVMQNEAIELPWRQRHFVQKDQEVYDDERYRHHRRRKGSFRGAKRNHAPVRVWARVWKSLWERRSARSIKAFTSSRPAMPPRAPMRVQLSAAIALENS